MILDYLLATYVAFFVITFILNSIAIIYTAIKPESLEIDYSRMFIVQVITLPVHWFFYNLIKSFKG